jgi:hypothetical protein
MLWLTAPFLRREPWRPNRVGEGLVSRASPEAHPHQGATTRPFTQLQNARDKIVCVSTASLTRALDTAVADDGFQSSRSERPHWLRRLLLAPRRLGSEEQADWSFENRRPQCCLSAQ